MKNNQARSLFRPFAAAVALLMWVAALLFGFQAIVCRDLKQVAGSVVACLLALLFTFVAFKGEAPRWLYFIFTWGERP